MTQATLTKPTPNSRDAARIESDTIARVARIASGVLFAFGGVATFAGQLELSGLALLGGVAAAVAAATQRPKRVGGWLGVAILAAALVVVAAASLR